MTTVPPSPDAGVTAPPPPAASGTAVAHSIGATKVYGSGDTEVHALRDVSVSFEPGRFTSIMGPSGSGKSTLMQCMAGLDRLTAGEAFIQNVPLSGLSDKDLTLVRREKIGFVFQAFNLIPTLDALENITLPVDLAGDQVDQDWLDQVVKATGLAERLTHRPNELSGGQQQRVAVARALVSRPAIIFADEPTGNLDSKTSAEILDFMRRAVDDLGQTIVMVTHDPFSASHSDQVLFLSDGRIVDEMFDPTPDGVFNHIKSLGG
ncbi:MAG: ABC transporter ATP-binding protein [Acidimicrobiales bacterium]